MKFCFKCGAEKDEKLFVPNTNECKECKKEYRKQYYQVNKDHALKQANQYYIDNRNVVLDSAKLFYNENKDRLRPAHKAYYLGNKGRYFANNNAYVKKRRKTDPSYAISRDVSTKIRRSLAIQGSSKNNNSIWLYLPYTIQELKIHLEQKFEPWMNWNNRGSYNSKSWNDDDPATWTWNVDHIIPQSDLLFSSMTDENFQKCWALSNLRPYSAKQNVLDGTNRIRHKQ